MPDENDKLESIKQVFYDIESLDNVFSLCSHRYNENILDVYFLVDDKLDTPGDGNGKFVFTDEIKNVLTQRIYEHNKIFTGTVEYHYLTERQANIHLINIFGAKDDQNTFENLAATEPAFHMLVNDTDVGYSNTEQPYLLGYNSFNYDTTMYALYVSETFYLNNGQLAISPPTARQMRDHNNNLFSAKFKERMPSYLQQNKDNTYGSGYANRENIIRSNLIRSGRYVDIALLNEKMQKVALKRVLGMLGYQILESDKLKGTKSHIDTLDELAELIAYNASDTMYQRMLFIHQRYQGNFELKKGLLESYPELVYNKKEDSYAPDVRPDNVRRDRLYIDSSSAKLASRTLCPYGNLNDIEAVSFMYPSEEKSKELGIPRVNVLDECRKFFYGLYPNNPDLQAEFDRIYFYYKNNIEGKNFNESDEYQNFWSKQHPNAPVMSAVNVSQIPKCNLTLPYYNADGSASSCYVAFGTGGVHGAEYNKALYDADMRAYEEIEALHTLVRTQYPDPTMLKKKNPETKKAWSFEYNGKIYKSTDFLKTGSTATSAEWKDISKKKPLLFKPDPKGSFKLNKRYVYTSNDDSSHEDFMSYYPNLLIMMQAFMNEGLGYDRYAEIFDNKQHYGKLMKDPSLSEKEQYHYSVLREGTKLILNSASGAADAAFFTPIRMNNQILSMRIIGQLFTWRIGQAQTYAGAKIISTNTDGLYSVFEPEENARILAREAANIHVAIEPEFCHLVSKDSNNRMELDEKNRIISASGGSLACRKSPDPTKSLAHAAILDYALCEYMRNADNMHFDCDDFLAREFDRNKGLAVLYNSRFTFPDSARYLNMFQTIVASSLGSQTFIFGETDNLQGYKSFITGIPFDQNLFNAACISNDINIMQHYNRVFFVKKEFGTIYNKPIFHLYNASTRVVTAAQKLTRKKNNLLMIQHDPYAKALLEKFDIHDADIPEGKEAKITKVSGIDPDWYVYIENRSLFELSEDEKQLLISNLNMDNYLTLLADSFNKNWANIAKTEGDDDETGISA